MKTFQKVFTAMCLLTIVGLVGCNDANTTNKTGTKSRAKTDEGSGTKTHAEGVGHSHDDGKTEPQKTEPKKTDIPTPDENPDVDKVNPDEAESGSSEKKGGLEIPEDSAPGEAQSGSSEKKGGLDVPKE